LYIAGALDASEREELRLHLARGCSVCSENLAEAKAAWAAIPQALDPVSPAPRVKERLLERIGEKSDRFPDSLGLRIFRVLVPAAVAAGIAVVVTHATLSPRIHQLQMQANASALMLSSQDRQIESLQAGLSKQQQLVAMLRTPQTKLIELAGTDRQPAANACIVWDQKTGRWRLLTAGMTSPPAGKTYELWFVTKAGQKIPATTFNVNSDGEADMMVDVPPDIGPLALATVTDEPLGGVPQPTGNFQLTGKIE